MNESRQSGRQRYARRNSGFALIYIAILFVVLVGLLALGVDIGQAHLSRTQVQAAADAAARAGVWKIPDLDFAGAEQDAVTVANFNEADGDSVPLDPALDIQFGQWNRTTRTFTQLTGDARVAANALRVVPKLTDERGNPVEYDFAPVMGADGTDVEAVATAMIRGGYSSWGHGLGIFGIDWVELNGTTTTDSYDPTLPYGGDNVGDNGGVGSNGDIELVGTADLYGDARSGPDADDYLTKNTNSTITGWQAPLDEEVIFPPGQVPECNDNDLLIEAGMMDSNGNIVGRGNNTNADVFNFPVAPSPCNGERTTYVVHNLDISGQSSISVEGPVTVYVTGYVKIVGNSDVNPGGLPANLQIIVVGSGDVDIGGGSATYAHIYAPESDIRIHGTQDTFGLFGSVVGKTIDILGNSAIHYDGSNFMGGNSGPPDFYVELVE